MFDAVERQSDEPSVRERRRKKRIYSDIDVRFFWGNLFYSGLVSNLSENGMFVKTKLCLPPESMFILLMPLEGMLMKVVARVIRKVKPGDGLDGMGLELINVPPKYTSSVMRHGSAAYG